MLSSLEGHAVFSLDGLYRYRLWRRIAAKGLTIGWIMVNPSTATAVKSDPTINRVVGFSRALGAAEILVGNKFARVSTDVKLLAKVRDPVGPSNNKHLQRIMIESDMVIVAWGSLGKLPPALRTRCQEVQAMADEIGCELQALSITQNGDPGHPLYLPKTAQPFDWRM